MGRGLLCPGGSLLKHRNHDAAEHPAQHVVHKGHEYGADRGEKNQRSRRPRRGAKQPVAEQLKVFGAEEVAEKRLDPVPGADPVGR